MPPRTTIQHARDELLKLLDKAGEYWLDRQPADMGNYAGVVQVPGTQSMVYVRVANGQVIQVFNDMAPNIKDWKVYIGRDKSQPDVMKVIEVRWVYNIALTTAYVLFHHKQHEYPAPDTVWVRRDQFMPLLVLPKTGFHVMLFGDTVYRAGMAHPVRVADNNDIDLTSYSGDVGAFYVLMEAKSDGTLNFKQSTNYGSLAALYLQPLPTPTDGSFPICAFIFYEGQTQLRRDSNARSIIDLRMFTSDASPTLGGQVIAATQAAGLIDSDWIGFSNKDGAPRKISFQYFKRIFFEYTEAFVIAKTIQIGSSAGGDLAGTYPNPTVAKASNDFSLPGWITSDPLLSDVNDWDPTGLANAVAIKIDPGSSGVRITGLTGGAAGRIIFILNTASNVITLSAWDSASSPENRFGVAEDIALDADQGAFLMYDPGHSVWRCIGRSAGGGGSGGITLQEISGKILSNISRLSVPNDSLIDNGNHQATLDLVSRTWVEKLYGFLRARVGGKLVDLTGIADTNTLVYQASTDTFIPGAGGSSFVYDVLTSQVPAVGNHYDLASTAVGTVLLFYNSSLQSTSTFTMDGDNGGLTTSFSPVAGDVLIAVYGITGNVVQVQQPPSFTIFMYQNFR